MKMYLEWVGLVAGSCTTIAFLPQVVKTWKTKSAKDLSLGMFSIFTFGVGMWLAYGIMRNDWPIILANLMTLCFAATLLYFKLRWRD
jgi:MtN3 and saliva related transmembrane protein